MVRNILLRKPRVRFERVIAASEDDAREGVVRIPTRLMRREGPTAERFARHQYVWVRAANGRRAVRQVMGFNARYLRDHGIGAEDRVVALSYETRAYDLALGEEAGVEIYPAGPVGMFLFNWNHPDRRERRTFRTEVVALVLGLISLL